MSFVKHCMIAFSLRIALVVYSNFHDQNFSVPYTDIDYKVFTDAARHIVEGRSPFERATYRYSPLLALLLTFNVLFFNEFGKVCFCVVDILIPILLRRIIFSYKFSKRMQNICAYLWLYNPLAIVISTRGNADSIAVFLVLLTLNLLQCDKVILAGLIHGLSIHFRLYPIVFSLAMYLSLRCKNFITPNKSQLKLVCACIFAITLLTAVSYYFYGYEFLYESLIYHLIRKDARHNFSVYFYLLYLTANESPSLIQRILTFLPQLILLIVISCRYSHKRQLPFSLLAQAMVMVTYNPVLTSQYVFWFLSLIPLCLPNLKMSNYRLISLITAWFFSKGLWLAAAYFLEFQSVNTFSVIWVTSMIFFAVNIKILIDIIMCYKLHKL